MQTCLKELAKSLKILAACNVTLCCSSTAIFQRFLIYFKNNYFPEHLPMAASVNVIYVVLYQHEKSNGIPSSHTISQTSADIIAA